MSEKTDQLVKDLNEGRITSLQLIDCVKRHYAQRKSLPMDVRRVLCGDLIMGGRGAGVISELFRALNAISHEIIYNLEGDKNE